MALPGSRLSDILLFSYNRSMLVVVLSLLLSDAVADFNAGVSAANRGDLEQATQLFDRAQVASPAWGLPKIELAELLARQGGQADRVLQLIEQAVPLEPQNPRMYHVRALALLEQGNARDAEAAERSALAIRAEFTEAARTLAQALWEQGRRDEALAALKALSDQHPDDSALRATYVDKLSEAGRAVEAEKELRRLTAEQPRNPVWHRRLARTLDGEGFAKEASEERARAADLAGDVPARKRKLRRLPDSKR